MMVARGTAQIKETEIFATCEKVKAEQTRLFRRLVGGQGEVTTHLLVDD